MAAELINSVLKAESSAKKEEKLAKANASKILDEAKRRAESITIGVIGQAKSEAAVILSDAELSCEGIIKQAEKLALLREKRVISETERRYDECIALVLENLV